MVKILQGDCREVLKTLPDESVHCVVTSPPYWGLRDYGVVGQLGLQETPQAYVEDLVAVFTEAWRVLRSDGTLWLNLGDSYASTPPGCAADGVSRSSTLHGQITEAYRDTLRNSVGQKRNTVAGGLKPKDLCGVPWRVALAMQAEGWWLRSDIIWSKPACMPESVADRPTKAHEYLFLLAKSERYYYDHEAIKEPGSEDSHGGGLQGEHRYMFQSGRKDSDSGTLGVPATGRGRNKRSVWAVNPQPFQGAHFATFPPALIEPCILAGCPEGGTVLDPFGGAGTTGLVADRHKRNAILIELNPEYAEMARRRIFNDAPLFAEVQ